MPEDRGEAKAEKMSETEFVQAGQSLLSSLTMWASIALNRRNAQALTEMQASLGLLFQECERICKEISEADGVVFPGDTTTVQ